MNAALPAHSDLRPSAREEFRRGWRLILGSLCGIAFGVTGLFFYSMGIFLKPVATEFGWSRGAASTVSLVAALSLALTAPFVGRIVDAVGTRAVALTGCIGLACGFFALSQSPPSLGIYLTLVVVTVLLGAGASPVAYTRLLNIWFDRARGTALGLAQMATGIAGALLPVLLIPYLASHGWRAAFQALAWVSLGSAPLVLLLLGRDRPPPTQAPPPLLDRVAATVTMPRRVFATLLSIVVLAAVGVSGIIVHIVPLLSDAGLAPARVSAIAGLLGVGIIVGRALTGLLVDRFFAPRIGCLAFAAAAGGCWLLAGGGTAWAALATLLTGLAMGAEIDLISYLVARYYGVASYGRIYGLAYAAFMVGTSVGPLLAGAAFDHFRNYRAATVMLGASLALASLLTWTLPRFKTAMAALDQP